MLRMRAMTSLARCASPRMRSSAWPALARLGGSWASQRWQALPLVTMAASGWLTSWAMEAVNCPRLVVWVMRSSWVRAAWAAFWAATIFRPR